LLGHFEFRGFVVTGATRTLDHGPDALMLTGPEYIFSGHFHKRQYNGNIVYIGNTFPTNYGDASDNQRGCAVFDVENNDVYFHDWDNAPLFFKTRLSTVLNGEMGWPEKSRVRCTLDVDLGYSDVQALREEMVKMFSLREFTIDEDAQVRKGLLTDGLELETELDMSTLDSSVRQLISEGVQASATIDPQLLISIYDGIQL
jgi:DNA repair exonuclease SbcCD nuclease subunit